MILSQKRYPKRGNKSFNSSFFPRDQCLFFLQEIQQEMSQRGWILFWLQHTVPGPGSEPNKEFMEDCTGVLCSFFGLFRTEYLVLRVKTMAWHGHSMGWRGKHGQMCPNISKSCLILLPWHSMNWETGEYEGNRDQRSKSFRKHEEKATQKPREFWSWVIFLYRSPGMKKNVGTCGH